LVRAHLITLAGLACAGIVQAGAFQSVSDVAFEIASIKPAGQMVPAAPGSPDRFVRRGITLSLLLVYVSELSELQIQGGPDWVRSERFDIEAKADGRPTAERMRRMVHNLLAERFRLTTHVETRELPRYVLLKARSDGRLGPKLRPSEIDCPSIIAGRDSAEELPAAVSQPIGPPRCAFTFSMAGGAFTILLHGASISQFIRALRPLTDRFIVDGTGLNERYDIELETERPEFRGQSFQPSSGQQVDQRDGLLLPTALSEQLGLKLQAERGPVDVLIVDHVERPTAN